MIGDVFAEVRVVGGEARSRKAKSIN